jgi:peptidyl-tRNA hydrolase
MNESDGSVSRAYSKVGAERWGPLCAIHDGLELPVGEVRLHKLGKGTQCHRRVCRLMVEDITGYRNVLMCWEQT